jgi:hypothetical protein
MNSENSNDDDNQFPKVEKLVENYEHLLKRINRCAERSHKRSSKLTPIIEVFENRELERKEPEIVVESLP